MALAQEVEVLIPTLALLPVAVMTTDCNGVVRWANASHCDLTGYAVAETVGQHAGMLEPENATHPLHDIIHHVVAGGEPWKGESVGRRKNGALHDIEQTITPIRDGSGRTTHLLWTKVAVPDRSAVDELRRCKEELDILKYNSPIPYQSLNAEGCLVEVNEAWLQGLGYAREEVIGRWFGGFLVPDQVDLFREQFPLFKERGWVQDVEFRMVRKDGSSIHVAFDGNVGRDRDGRFRQTHCVWRDIGKRKRAEDASHQAEANLSALIESTKDIVWSVDLDYKLLTFNRALHEFFEHSFGVLAKVGMGPEDLLPPERATLWPPLYERALSDGPFRVEYTLLDGRTLEMAFNPVRRDGRITGISAFGKDITERKVAEQKLREAESKYRNIYEGALEGIFRASPDERTLAANPALAKMLGYDSAEEVVSAITDAARQVWFDPAEYSQCMQQLDDHGVARGYECRFKRKDGSVIWVLLGVRRVFGEDGQALYTEGFIEDISERKRAEEALYESERRLREMLENGQLVSVILDQRGDITFCNEFLLRLTGWQRDEIVGRNWFELFVPPEQFDQERFIREFAERNLPAHYNNEIITKAGKRYMISWNNTFLFDVAHVPIGTASIGEDITERIRLENELHQAQKMESVGRLAGGVAHDFNNLLTVINGYSDLVLKRLKASDPLRSYVEEIKTAGERAVSLTKQLLAFSRKQVIEPRMLDLNTTIRASVPMLQRVVGEDIALETHLDNSLGQVMADPNQVHQVLMNLLVNARDAMPEGGKVEIETRNGDLDEESAAAHPAAMAGRYILMTVTDSGHGMDDATCQHIFEPFFTTKESGKGTGLGLATVYGIIKQTDGWIDVRSEVGVGTSFMIYLPRIDGCPLPERNGIIAPTEGGGETILLVEDEEAVRSLAKAALKQHGYQVIEASDGEEAIAVAERHLGKIHLLLTDVVMPGMNGKELSERLRVLCPHLKVLFVSGYTANVIAHGGVIEHGITYMPKPFSPDGLAAKVRRILADPFRPATGT